MAKYELQPIQTTEIEDYRYRVKNALSDFMNENELKFIVGISGGAENITDKQATCLIADFIINIQDSRCAILTGGTQGGIPELGVRIAKASSIPTVGLFPKRGRKYALYNELDLVIETVDPTIGEGNFGTETPSFVNLLDGATIIGGGFGTLTEATTILKTNTSRVRYNEKPIYLCPVTGTGGAADVIKNLPDLNPIRDCLPDRDIYTGADAARFLKYKLT